MLVQQDVDSTGTIQGQASLACYGGAAVKLFGSLSGLSLREQDQHLLDEKFQASLDFHTIGAAYVRGLTGGITDGNCAGPFQP